MKNVILKALAITFVVSAAAQAGDDVVQVSRFAMLKAIAMSPVAGKKALYLGAGAGALWASNKFVVKPVMQIKKDVSAVRLLQESNSAIFATDLMQHQDNPNWAPNIATVATNNNKIENLRWNIAKNATKAAVSAAVISGGAYVLYKKLSSN